MDTSPDSTAPTRRDLLKLAPPRSRRRRHRRHRSRDPAPGPRPEPKRGVLRLAHQLDPVGLDPHQTISFATMIPLSFIYSRLMKVRAGPAGWSPSACPVETDLAESWTRPSDTTYVFKLRKGVRWRPKPPVDGRELAAADVGYTYERFLAHQGESQPARALRCVRQRVEAVDRHTVEVHPVRALRVVRSTPSPPPRPAIVGEGGRGEVRRPPEGAEAAIGTGPFMLERHEPNVRMTFARQPHYFVTGLPYVDGIDLTIDADPASRFSGWLSGKYDFGPEYQQVVRRTEVLRHRPPSPRSGSRDPRSMSGSRGATRRSELGPGALSRMFACAGPWGARATGGSSSRRARTPSDRAPPTWRSPRPRRSGPSRSPS